MTDDTSGGSVWSSDLAAAISKSDDERLERIYKRRFQALADAVGFMSDVNDVSLLAIEGALKADMNGKLMLNASSLTGAHVSLMFASFLLGELKIGWGIPQPKDEAPIPVDVGTAEEGSE